MWAWIPQTKYHLDQSNANRNLLYRKPKSDMQLDCVYVTFNHGQLYCDNQFINNKKNNNILKTKIEYSFFESCKKNTLLNKY